MAPEDRVTATDQAVFETAARRYALGALDDGQSLAVEERVVNDPKAYDILRTVGDELMEDYLDDALPGEDRHRFETHFLAMPEHPKRLEALRALRAKAAAPPAGILARTGRFATAAIVVVAASGAVGTWLALHPAAVQAPSPARRSASAPAAPIDAAPATTPAPGSPTSAPASVGTPPIPVGPPVFRLRSGLTRGAGAMARLAIPGAAKAVRLQLETPSPLSGGAYRIAIEGVDGGRIHTAQLQRPAGEAGPLTVTVPAAPLIRGDYRLTLTTLDDGGTPQTVATFPFRVTSAGADATAR